MRLTCRANCCRRLAVAVACADVSARSASAELKAGWDGKRHISYQQQKDLFYNYYAQPGPYNGAAAEMYVSPRPVPPTSATPGSPTSRSCRTSIMYNHQRSYYTHNPGAGWRRTNVRYGTGCLRCRELVAEMHFPMSNNIWALHNDFYYPGHPVGRSREHCQV